MPTKKPPTKKKVKKMETQPGSFTLVDNKKRSVLSEGRSYGIAFGMAKRDGNKLVTVGPISPCREYLNDQIGSELSGNPISAYGYHAKKEGLMDDESLYVIFGILPHFHGSKYDLQDEETKFLAENFKAIQSFVNQIEDLLKVGDHTVVEKLEDNRYVAITPKFWGKSSYLISLHSLLFRVSVEGGYKEGDALKFFESAKTTDQYNLPKVAAKIRKMAEGTFPEQKSYGHSYGIVNQAF